MARILVVDDEPDIVRAVVRIMRACGYDVDTARDGQMAIDQVALDAPDLIIIDLALPRLNGQEVCERLKSQPATQGIPVVMMTSSYLGLDDMPPASPQRADGYLIKPFSKRDLLHVTERLLAGHAALDDRPTER
ncbi:MAG: response regulator transcription factor [Haliangiales bacterium]